MLFGYARVSTAIQNPDHQIDALTRTGVARKHIYLDHASGAKASRPKLMNSSANSATATPWPSHDSTASADPSSTSSTSEPNCANAALAYA